MSKIRKAYTSEFKREALRLLETSGKSVAQIERDLGVGPGCLSRWKHQLSQDGDAVFPGHGRVMPEQERLRRLEHENAMNGVGTWYDNAPMESFFGTLKSEWIYLCVYRARNEARTSVFSYIEAFYNRRRRHSALDYLSPEVYEQRYYKQLKLGLTPCPQN